MTVRSVFSAASGRPTETRRRRSLVVLAVFALILLTINLAGWRVYQSMRDTLDRELGERLKAIATAAADRIDAEYAREIETRGAMLEAALVRGHLESLRDRLAVADLALLTLDGEVLVDLADSTAAGTTHPLRRLHPEAFDAARDGAPSTGRLMSSLGRHTKAGFAPVTDIVDDKMTAVVAVEAGATYFEALNAVGRAVIFANAASAFAVIALGLLLYRVLRMQTEIDETVRRTETLSVMGEMTASVAHEIKNPLGIIRATAERLQKRYGGEDPDPIFDYIPDEVDRLDRILTTYLDFARAETGRPGERGTCEIAPVIDDVFALVERDLVAADVDVVRRVPEGLRAAIAPGALKQVILNLTLNARRAMAEGGELLLEARREDGRIVIDVADTGIGIEAHDLERIFEPFVSGRADGSGLGLSIVKRVVEESGGEIRVTSEPGSGTRFSINLPRGEGT